jgi:hypothetical protein
MSGKPISVDAGKACVQPSLAGRGLGGLTAVCALLLDNKLVVAWEDGPTFYVLEMGLHCSLMS